MHNVSIATYLSSCLLIMLITGCSGQRIFNSVSDQNELPSLRKQTSNQVIQVASTFDETIARDHPYFIVCQGDDCSGVTPKTPINSRPIKTVPSMTQKGRTVDGTNTTYLKKSTSILEQFRVHFGYASAKVTDAYQSLLKSFVDDYPHQQETIRVTGFTDSGSKPGGTVGNEWLALERAISVKQQLIDLGYPASQVLLEAKFLCCYIDSNESEAGRFNNRRAELSLIHNVNKKGDSL